MRGDEAIDAADEDDLSVGRYWRHFDREIGLVGILIEFNHLLIISEKWWQ